MGFGDVIGLLVSTGGLIGVVAILSQAYRRRLEHKERMAELRAGSAQPASPERDATIERLEHRIRVLERIATDHRAPAQLASEIDQLR